MRAMRVFSEDIFGEFMSREFYAQHIQGQIDHVAIHAILPDDFKLTELANGEEETSCGDPSCEECNASQVGPNE